MSVPDALELWAGPECTVNRIHDRYRDQLAMTGHAHRLDDLERLRDLGVRTVRYPVLWERTAPGSLVDADWSWPDERLAGLRERGMAPIVGLIHHGSGPAHTDLLDPEFPNRLAQYAAAVSRRYPWVDAYTPVNEPLTTARFSALYGHWYPHARDGLAFARALLNQCRATVLAMRAIRAYNPHARLVQTEDLGQTFSTPTLRYQADFENERRWLTFDVLTGALDRGHELWRYLIGFGVAERELQWFLDNPCPPDVVGVNTYMTSQRFLDERVDLYPPESVGGNGRHRYADVEAIRVREAGLVRTSDLLRQAWERYGRPLAITEAHLGCTREEQLRWLLETWDEASVARSAGCDVRAVTVWSVFGACDWDSLLTRERFHYEPGAYDMRSIQPRRTAIASLAGALARGHRPSHPLFETPGWWNRNIRFVHGLAVADDGTPVASPAPERVGRGGGTEQPIVITGASGTLGRACARLCEQRGLPHRLLSRRDMDIAAPASVERALDDIRPWAVVNTAGFVRVDDAEHERDACFRENAHGPAVLAAACAARGVPLVTFSSDLVFDGTKGSPYLEQDAPRPLNVYGASKVEAERCVQAAMPSALIVRTSAFFGPWDAHNFVAGVLSALSGGHPFIAAEDARVSPTYVPDLVNAALDLLIDGEGGIWHVANEGSTTWAELARDVAVRAKLNPSLVDARPQSELGLAATRPRDTTLGSARAQLLPTLDDALERFMLDIDVRRYSSLVSSDAAPAPR